jgi:hypothetical protein
MDARSKSPSIPKRRPNSNEIEMHAHCMVPPERAIELLHRFTIGRIGRFPSISFRLKDRLIKATLNQRNRVKNLGAYGPWYFLTIMIRLVLGPYMAKFSAAEIPATRKGIQFPFLLMNDAGPYGGSVATASTNNIDWHRK